MIFILYLFIGLVLLWIIGGLIYSISFLFKKKFGLALLLIGFASLPFWFVYAITYTPDSFFEAIFVRITAEPFPASAKIIKKRATSTFLDHSNAAVIQLDTADFDRIYTIVSTDSVYRRDYMNHTTAWRTHGYGSELLQRAKIPNTGFEKYDLGSKRTIGFCSNRKYIIIEDVDY